VNTTPPISPVRTRVYIFDDHALIRYGLKQVISNQPDMEVCGESDEASSAFEDICRLHPDVILVEISWKGDAGIKFIQKVRAAEPATRMIALSVHPESVYGIGVLKAGAHGYFMKHDQSERLLAAIRKVTAGGISVSESLARRVSIGLQERGPTFEVGLLTDREREIVVHVGRGMTMQEIAMKLHLSVKTIERHRAYIKGKLNVKSATEFVQWCIAWVTEHQLGPSNPAHCS
jgi:DNA-binding NarL/FixJ family response regulator